MKNRPLIVIFFKKTIKVERNNYLSNKTLMNKTFTILKPSKNQKLLETDKYTHYKLKQKPIIIHAYYNNIHYK